MAEQIAAGDAGAAAAARQGQGRMLLLSLAGAVLFGAGGFALAYLGRIDPGTGTGTATADTASQPGFVPIDRMIVSLGGPGRARHLRFAAEIEVPLAHLDEVTLLRPRIVDMLNGYLRAVDPDVIADPGALTELRAQMLRRVQVVAGEGRVNDFLIVEFVMD
jgi:flagellar protein FliL